MNQNPEQGGNADWHEGVNRRTFLGAAIVAGSSLAAGVLFRNLFAFNPPANAANPPDWSEINSAWLQGQDRMLEARQRPLQEGDDGLVVKKGENTIRFEYSLTLHPLRELPTQSAYVHRLDEFIQQWMRTHVFVDSWVVGDVEVEDGFEPDERCIVPNSMHWYKLKCVATRKPPKWGGLMA